MMVTVLIRYYFG